MIQPGEPAGANRIWATLEAMMSQDAAASEAQILGFGFRSVAVETGAGEVILLGKIPETATTYERTYRLAPELGRALPASIPQPRWRLPASDELPGGALCYPRIPGRPLNMADIESDARQQIVSDLVEFLLAFHAFPVERARAFGVPVEGYEAWPRTVEAVLPALREVLNPGEYETVDGWWRDLRDDGAFWNAPRAFRHGDFWHENILIDNDTRTLQGVIDLEYIAVSDPACDLATLRHLDHDFAGEVARAYGAAAIDVGPEFERRIDRYWELREFDRLQFAIEYDDPDELEDGLAALRAGPVLSPQ